jgi:hypothetical protein
MGDEMIRIKYIHIILFAISLLNLGITVGLADISGSWKPAGGFGADTMEVTQSGDHVYGTYSTHQGLGTINGHIYAGNIWRGWWSDPLGSGHFMVTFSDDFNSFSGSWGYFGSGLGDGTLQGEKVVA